MRNYRITNISNNSIFYVCIYIYVVRRGETVKLTKIERCISYRCHININRPPNDRGDQDKQVEVY